VHIVHFELAEYNMHARYGQMVTLKWGLAQSNNWISAYLMSKLNPSQFVSTLHEFGINNPDIHPSMSLCLGPCANLCQQTHC
jgi:Membrane carboxypeptidase (penicillin-binding protein)